MKRVSPIVIILIISSPLVGRSAPLQPSKGLLPEITLDSTNEKENQEKLIASELMIQNSENQAIAALTKILNRKKSTSEEPDLIFRLAELYLKKARSSRNLSLAKGKTQEKTYEQHVHKALELCRSLEKRYPNYPSMDTVLFAHAFAANQIGLTQEALNLYKNLLEKHPKSTSVPDATLEIGEIYYSDQKYEQALRYFEMLENYKSASVYMYGRYKSAWTLYNLRKTKPAIDRLIEVAERSSGNDETRANKSRSKHNLRKEALRDLSVFASEVIASTEIYSFFKKITRAEELGPVLVDLAKLNLSHSKYRDLLTILNGFVSEEPGHPQLISAHLLMIEAYEALKERPKVIETLDLSLKSCGWKSSWRKSVPFDISETSCTELKEMAYEMSSKWWDIWLKNKNHKDFSRLTLQAFRLLVENEDERKPDLKAHYAYAELLFQLEDFETASQEYAFVGKHSNSSAMQHDSKYSALFSQEKLIAKNPKEKEAERQRSLQNLAVDYVTTQPNGKYIEDVKFKLGLMAYERNKLEEATQWLLPLAQKAATQNLRTRSQDLYLDILNLKKDYAELKKAAREFQSQSTEAARQGSLSKIALESHYNEVQSNLNRLEYSKAVQTLKEFIHDHPKDDLAQKSLWQLTGLHYAQGKILSGNASALLYARLYPKDPKTIEAIQTVVDREMEMGLIPLAIPPLLKLMELDSKNQQKYLTHLVEAYRLEGDFKNAYEAIDRLSKGKTGPERAKLLAQKYEVAEESQGLSKNQKVLQESEKQILDENIEPYATRILTRRAQDLYTQSKHSNAFDLSLKILKRDTSPSERAPARMVQAKILFQEYISQSVKARPDRLATVIALKTEKLDKAQQAFLSVSNMTEDPALQYASLEALAEIFDHYVKSVTELPIPSEFSEQDALVLRKQLAELTRPILEKSKEAHLKILEFEKKYPRLSQVDKPAGDFKIYEFGLAQTQPFLPLNLSLDSLEERWSKKLDQKDCKSEPTPKALAACFQSRNWQTLEEICSGLVEHKETREFGWYYLSLVSEAEGKPQKSLWLLGRIMDHNKRSALASYQRARLWLSLGKRDLALEELTHLSPRYPGNIEFRILSAYLDYQKGKVEDAKKFLSGLNESEIMSYNIKEFHSDLNKISMKRSTGSE